MDKDKMPIEHKVEQGECISSIAEKYGFFPETLWDLPENSDLKELRKDPNILLAGDKVIIPDKRVKEVAVQTGQRHSFKRKGVPEVLKICLKDEDDEPRAELPYVLELDGKRIEGTTDADGILFQYISPNAKNCKITISSDDPDEEEEVIEIKLGNLDPITEITGVQARLNNLGYDCGKEDGKLNERTRDAIEDFQIDHELENTGELNDETLKKLDEEYKSK